MSDLVEGHSYPFSVKPTVRGDYCFWAYGCASFAPCYASFDGTNWVGSCYDDGQTFWIYTPNPEPYGHDDPSIGLDPEVKNDLQSRLERYKASKAS